MAAAGADARVRLHPGPATSARPASDDATAVRTRAPLTRRLAVLVALSLVLKGVFLAAVLRNPGLAVAFGDPGSYYELARDMWANLRFESSIRPILFPLVYAGVVAVFGTLAPLVMVALQYTTSIWIGLLLYQLVWRSSQSEPRALLAFSMYALNPVVTLYESSTFSEPFFNLLTVMGMAAYLSGRLVATGAWFAAVSLVRPAGAYLYAVLAFYEFVRGQKRRTVVLSALLFVAIVGPWVLRYHAKYGQYGLSNIGDFNLGLYQANFVYAEERGLGMTAARKQWVQHVYRAGGFEGKYPPPDVSKLDGTAAYWHYRHYPAITRFAMKEALTLYLRHPLVAAKYVLTGMALTAMNPASEPMTEFFGLPVSEFRRDKVVDSILRLDVSAFLQSGVTDYLNHTAFLSGIYLLMNMAGFAFLLRNVATRRANVAMVAMFAASWLVAGFGGVGGARYFVGSYVLFVLACLVIGSEQPRSPRP